MVYVMEHWGVLAVVGGLGSGVEFDVCYCASFLSTRSYILPKLLYLIAPHYSADL